MNETDPTPAVAPKKSPVGKIIGCSCLTLVVLVILGVGGFFFTITKALKSNEPYKTGIAAVQNSPEAIEALGEPIKEGFLPSGSVSLDGSDGEVDLTIPVSGPKGSGKVHVVGNRSAGVWDFSTIELAVEGRADRISLKD